MLTRLIRRNEKDAREAALGKIQSMSGNWVFSSDLPADIISNSHDDNGEQIILISQRSTLCPDTRWAGVKPQYATKYKRFPIRFWIPRSECTKCEHYAKRQRGMWFARCLLKATAKTGSSADIEARQQTIENLNSAAKKAAQIMGKDF